MKSCIIIPVYNHAEFLSGVMEAALRLELPIIAVNDGSTDATAECLRRWPQVSVITFTKNQGKGRALAAGLKRAGEMGCELAAVLDADGQHDSAGIPNLIAAAGDLADTLVVGSREAGQDGAPLKSRFGRKFSNFWVWVETGLKVPDTQSGLRVYPVAAMNRLRIAARRFGWEIEALVRAAWSGVKVVSVPVRISYAAKSRTHFRTYRDFFLVSCVNTSLVFERFLGIRFSLPSWEGAPQDWKGRLRYVWDILWQGKDTPSARASAIALGIFFSIFPVWGWQTVIALYLAHRWRLNKVLTLVAVNFSIPPMIPFVIYGSLLTGRLALQGQWNWALPISSMSLHTAQLYLKEFLAGSILLAAVAAAAAWLVSYPLLSLGQLRKGNR